MQKTDIAPTADTDSATPVPGLDVLALRAAAAYHLLAVVTAVCDPVIEANAARIRATPGVRTADATLPLDNGSSVSIGTFTQARSKPNFFVTDEQLLLDYADTLDETEYTVRPAFRTALLKRLDHDPETGTIVDTTTGLVVEGIGYDSGGLTNRVSPSWNPDGIAVLNSRLGDSIDDALRSLPGLTAEMFFPPGRVTE